MYRLKQVMAFIISNMIMTTMVFAQHTKATVTSDINNVLNSYEKLASAQTQKSMQCSERTTKRIVTQIDKRIAKAQRTNETLEESIQIEMAKYERVRSRQIRMTKRTLKRWWRVRRAYKKVRRTHPTLTKREFKEKLRDSISPEKTQEQKTLLISSLTEAGSMENYLLDMKEKVLNCDEVYFQNDNSGLILLIIFIGLPVLSILSAIFAVVFGAFWWALGLFVFAVVVLLAVFIWANVERLNINEKEDEIEPELDIV